MTSSHDLAYIAVGSNLGDRLAHLSGAAQALARGDVDGVRLTRASPVFETRPLGPARYPFLNAVLEVQGPRIDPEALLAALQRLEDRSGRQRQLRWGPRTLDLDLLAVIHDGASLHWQSPTLQLPHPELGRRDFVLAPLATLAPGLRPGAPRGQEEAARGRAWGESEGHGESHGESHGDGHGHGHGESHGETVQELLAALPDEARTILERSRFVLC